MAKLFAVSLRPGLMRGLLPSVLAYALSEGEPSADTKGKLFGIESIITRYTIGGIATAAGERVFYVWDAQLGVLRQYLEEFREVYSRVDRTYTNNLVQYSNLTNLTQDVASSLSQAQEIGGVMGFILRPAHPQMLRTKGLSTAALEVSKNLDSAVQVILKTSDPGTSEQMREMTAEPFYACRFWTSAARFRTLEIAVDENARRYFVDQISAALDAVDTNSDPTPMSHLKLLYFGSLLVNLQSRALGWTLLYLKQAFTELMQLLAQAQA